MRLIEGTKLPERDKELERKVFELLKRDGPLSVYQLSTELFVSSWHIHNAVHALADRGVVVPRPDSLNEELPPEDDVWGLPTGASL